MALLERDLDTGLRRNDEMFGCVIKFCSEPKSVDMMDLLVALRFWNTRKIRIAPKRRSYKEGFICTHKSVKTSWLSCAINAFVDRFLQIKAHQSFGVDTVFATKQGVLFRGASHPRDAMFNETMILNTPQYPNARHSGAKPESKRNSLRSR